MATKEQFDDAVQTVRDGKALRMPSDEIRLRLYGLYKRVVCGRCYEPIPLFFEVKKYAKHRAWTKTNTLTVQQAMDKYVDLVNMMLEEQRIV